MKTESVVVLEYLVSCGKKFCACTEIDGKVEKKYNEKRCKGAHVMG